MDKLCDELVYSILFELDDPSNFIQSNKRLYQLSKDPYVRANYFLSRYGHVEALYWAFTRGRLVNVQMLNILIASGAHLSRYFAQVAIHYYFRLQKHSFIKSPWVRSLSFPTFVHFQSIAAQIHGNIDVQKHQDDGAIFATFIKERKYPSSSKSIDWEKIRDLFTKHKFIPFCAKDPHMSQLPLAFAVEPRLIPLAIANGFVKDSKYRDFVFRKMFEKMSGQDRVRDIVNNVSEICRVDSDMFVTRTVASEILMDLKNNPEAYSALKELAQAGQLAFDLATLAADLLKSFFKSSSVTSITIKPVLRQIYIDYPSSDPVVRNVMLSVVFVPPTHTAVSTTQKIKSELDSLRLVPTLDEMANVLLHPFMDRLKPVVDYIKSEDGLGLGSNQVLDFAALVAVKCLELSFKGKMFRKLCETFPSVKTAVGQAVLTRYTIRIEDLPSWAEMTSSTQPSIDLEAKLAREGFDAFRTFRSEADKTHTRDVSEYVPIANGAASYTLERVYECGCSRELDELGEVSQEPLSRMILLDELQPLRARRRRFYSSSLDRVPNPPLPEVYEIVASQIKTIFGSSSPVTAAYFIHALINNNPSVIREYVGLDAIGGDKSDAIPITLDHFRMLAKLGHYPNYYLFQAISRGAEFYDSACDIMLAVKKEENRTPESSPRKTIGGKKRPRRLAGPVSYADPSSDDDEMMGTMRQDPVLAKRLGHLQKWIEALEQMEKSEQRKIKDYRKKLEVEKGAKVRVYRTEFLKTLASQMTSLYETEQSLQAKLYVSGDYDDDDNDEYDDDDDYHYLTRSKRPRH